MLVRSFDLCLNCLTYSWVKYNLCFSRNSFYRSLLSPYFTLLMTCCGIEGAFLIWCPHVHVYKSSSLSSTMYFWYGWKAIFLIFTNGVPCPFRKLEDSEAAEQYCAEIGRPDAYMQLVSSISLWLIFFFLFLLSLLTKLRCFFNIPFAYSFDLLCVVASGCLICI